MKKVILNVPYSEKDKVKQLGAKWDPEIKKWFITRDMDIKDFSKWMLKDVDKPVFVADRPILIARKPIYLLKSLELCWKCFNRADVFCLASCKVKETDWEMEIKGLFRLSFLRFVTEDVKNVLKKYAVNYYLDYSKMDNSYYYINHCKCGAKLGDFYMHNEPGSAFCPFSADQANGITIFHIESLGDISVNSDYSTQDPDYLLDHLFSQDVPKDEDIQCMVAKHKQIEARIGEFMEANRTKPKMSEYDFVRQAVKIQTEQKSTFSKEDVLMTAGRLSLGEHRISDLEKAFNELNKDKEIKQLDKNVYTIKRM